MANYFKEDGDAQIIGVPYGRGGYGGGEGTGFGGGSGLWCIIVFLIVAWLLFRQDRNDCNGNNYGGGSMPYPYPAYPYPPYGGGNCCSPLDCKIPMTPDMSNCEIDRDIWKVDADLLKCCCEEKEVTHMEAEATRALINANTMQDLRDKLAEKACEVQALKTQQYTDSKFDALNAKLCKEDHETDKQFGYINQRFDKLFCELPMRPPVWCEGITPNTHHTDCHDFPSRKGCGNDCGCGC